jgi:amino acid transporter
VYHTVPWQFVAQESLQKDVTAPGLLAYVLPGTWAVAIIAGAAIALLNDLPAMLLAVSRLMFAWAKDGIFPRALGTVHPRRHTPQIAIIVSGLMATLGVLGSHFASDFFLGIDIMVTSMLVNFLLMCLTVITLPGRNPALARQITVLNHRPSQLFLAWLGIMLLAGFLIIHTAKDLTADLSAWYFHSTAIWLIVMGIGSAVYFLERRKLEAGGTDLNQLFKQLPAE